jgi:hypothetical protein
VTAPLVRARSSTRNATPASNLFNSFDDMRFARFDDLLPSCII